MSSELTSLRSHRFRKVPSKRPLSSGASAAAGRGTCWTRSPSWSSPPPWRRPSRRCTCTSRGCPPTSSCRWTRSCSCDTHLQSFSHLPSRWKELVFKVHLILGLKQNAADSDMSNFHSHFLDRLIRSRLGPDKCAWEWFLHLGLLSRLRYWSWLFRLFFAIWWFKIITKSKYISYMIRYI